MPIALVQSASNAGLNGSSLTVTLGSPTTAGNCLVVATQGADTATNRAVTAVKLGGVADHFAALVASIGTAATTAGIVDLWADPACAGGQTAVAITWANVNAHEIQAFVYEFSGIAAANILDQSSTNFTTSTGSTFTSNATATTTQPNELWFGADGSLNGTSTGPASPWVNATQLGSAGRTLIAGYQIVSATGAATYSGTYSNSQFSETGVVALFGTPAGQPLQQFPPIAQQRILYGA